MDHIRTQQHYKHMEMRAVTHQPISAPGGYYAPQQGSGYPQPHLQYHQPHHPHTAPIMNPPMSNPLIMGRYDSNSNMPNISIHQNSSVVKYQDSHEEKRPWSTDLCSCCADITTCFQVIFCPLCTVMCIANRTDEGCWMPLCVPMSLMALRIKIRTHQDIEGSICKDCCATMCCTLCAICQMKREQDFIFKSRLTTKVKRGN